MQAKLFTNLVHDFVTKFTQLKGTEVKALEKIFPAPIGFIAKSPKDALTFSFVKDYFTSPTTGVCDYNLLQNIVDEISAIQQKNTLETWQNRVRFSKDELKDDTYEVDFRLVMDPCGMRMKKKRDKFSAVARRRQHIEKMELHSRKERIRKKTERSKQVVKENKKRLEELREKKKNKYMIHFDVESESPEVDESISNEHLLTQRQQPHVNPTTWECGMCNFHNPSFSAECLNCSCPPATTVCDEDLYLIDFASDEAEAGTPLEPQEDSIESEECDSSSNLWNKSIIEKRARFVDRNESLGFKVCVKDGLMIVYDIDQVTSPFRTWIHPGDHIVSLNDNPNFTVDNINSITGPATFKVEKISSLYPGIGYDGKNDATIPAALQGSGTWYTACKHAIVREGKEMDSKQVRMVRSGEKVRVVKEDGMRVMIDYPVYGWCSQISSQGDIMLVRE